MVVTSTDNAAVKAARKVAARRDRSRPDLVLVEAQAVRAALDRLERLFVSERTAGRHAAVMAAAAARGVPVVEVTEEVLASIAPTVTPQGVVGVAALDRPSLPDVLAGAHFAVALWQAADPGNVGTAIRTADAAGADAVVLCAGSADAGNPKAVRASAGSLFHLPVVTGVDAGVLVDEARRHGLQLVAAAAGGGVAHTEVDWTRRSVAVFGSEAHGLPAQLLDAADVVATIPLFRGRRPQHRGHAESLNLAASVAVVAFEASRQRLAADLHGEGGTDP